MSASSVLDERNAQMKKAAAMSKAAAKALKSVADGTSLFFASVDRLAIRNGLALLDLAQAYRVDQVVVPGEFKEWGYSDDVSYVIQEQLDKRVKKGQDIERLTIVGYRVYRDMQRAEVERDDVGRLFVIFTFIAVSLDAKAESRPI